MKYLLTLLLFVFVFGCSKTSDSTITISDSADSIKMMQNISLDSLDFSILKYDSSHRYTFPSTFKPADLSSQEVIECEMLLRAYVLNYNIEATKEFEEVTKKLPNLKFDIKQFTMNWRNTGDNTWPAFLRTATRLCMLTAFVTLRNLSIEIKNWLR